MSDFIVTRLMHIKDRDCDNYIIKDTYKNMSNFIVVRLLYITSEDCNSKITEDTFKLSPKGSMVWLSYSGLEDSKCCAIFLHKASNMKTFHIHHNPVSDIVHGYDVKFELFNTQYRGDYIELYGTQLFKGCGESVIINIKVIE